MLEMLAFILMDVELMLGEIFQSFSYQENTLRLIRGKCRLVKYRANTYFIPYSINLPA